MPRPPRPDPFVLDRRIGAGATGEVWRGVHPSTGLPVAVKILRKAGADSAAELRHEARAVARLDHPHVIRLYDHGVLDDGRPWIAMEHASGGSLQGRSAVSFRQLATWLLAVLDGLGHAHARGVLHLDLSPGNVVVGGPADRRPGLKLADFGVASQPGQQGGHAGTAPFMAPEQFGNPDGSRRGAPLGIGRAGYPSRCGDHYGLWFRHGRPVDGVGTASDFTRARLPPGGSGGLLFGAGLATREA